MPKRDKQDKFVQRSLSQQAWIQFRNNRLAICGLVVIALLILVSINTILIDLADGGELYKVLVTKNNLSMKLAKPSAAHLLGCDEYGRDLLFRLLWGTRYSLFAGICTILAAILIGGVFGSIAGFYGGKIDNVIMRFMDMVMTVPSLVLAMAIYAALGSSLVNLLIALTCSQVPQFARIIRSSVMTVKDSEYVEAAKAVGASDALVIVKYIIPNALSPVIVQGTLGVASGTKALNDSRVRQAIEYAIDKDALCSSVMYGYATPAASLVGPGVFGYDDSATANIYNIEKAKELLSAAGYPNGFEMSVWVQSADQTRQEACVVLQDMLSEVGITVSVEPMDGTVMDDTIVKGGDFDACSSMYYNLMGDADYVLYSNISPESTSNLSHYNNPDVMAKLLAARSLTDDAERAAVYKEISSIMAVDRPYIPLWAYQNLVGVRSGVSGFQLNPITAYRYENVANGK